MPSDISYFGDMLLSTFGFRRRVSRCPGGLLLSTPSLYERNFACTDTAHQVIPLVLRGRNSGRKDAAREIFKDGDYVNRLGVRKQMLFDVSHIGAPEFFEVLSKKR